MKRIILLMVLILASCTDQGCSSKKNIRKDDEYAKVGNKIEQFPALDFSKLNNQEQQDKIIALFNDEICPCGCRKTFAQCLVMKNACKPGIMLGQWAIDQLSMGHPERYVIQGLNEEINAGFLATPRKVNLLGAHHRGNKKAPITIVEFTDFECPACKTVFKPLSKLIDDEKDNVQLYFMHFPLKRHANAQKAAVAAEAAGLQGKFWEMHDLLLSQNGSLNEDIIKTLASTIFNEEQMLQFEKDIQREDLAQKIIAQRDHAIKDLKLLATPAILFNGRPFHLSLKDDALKLRLAMELERASINCEARGP
ncbi:MAG: thioredoxin domain-containing protein [Myxococcales bacterium]|nr:thioredoxin domain-containing protein [Myxococcales bacterium]USN50502.1 MAG: thioredoxin domain-containing protein [Myxococcales bacterium]